MQLAKLLLQRDMTPQLPLNELKLCSTHYSDLFRHQLYAQIRFLTIICLLREL